MVLNTGGGNKGKGVARKFVSQNAGGGGAKTVRLAQAEGETYAIVKQLLGNCMCSVICSDGYKRLCIIRKKFTGRRKADNNVMSGTVVLVGKHDYGGGGSKPAASSSSSSALKCDLLYVYGDQEREKLRKVCDLSKLNAALGGGDTPASARQDDDGIKFVTSGTGVFNKYATEDSRKNVRTVAGLDALGENPATESARQTIIFGNQWIGEGMLPSDEEDEEDEDEGGDEEEDEDDEEEEEEEEEEVRIIAPAHNKQQSTHTHKQQRSQVQFINVDDI
jgi:translation initiation factor IF-1